MKACLVIVLAAAVNTIPRWIPGIDGDVFCTWQAVSFVVMAIAGTMTKGTKTERYTWIWCVGLAINNAVDEALKVAKILNPFEIPFAVGVTLWGIYQIGTCLRSKK